MYVCMSCEALTSEGLNTLNTLLLTFTLEGEPRHVGAVLASIGSEVAVSGNLLVKLAGLVVGGETTVTVTECGIGGRNLELVLSADLKIKGFEGFVMASMNTDGMGCPTDAAGAIVDGGTVARAEELGLNCERHIRMILIRFLKC